MVKFFTIFVDPFLVGFVPKVHGTNKKNIVKVTKVLFLRHIQ